MLLVGLLMPLAFSSALAQTGFKTVDQILNQEEKCKAWMAKQWDDECHMYDTGYWHQAFHDRRISDRAVLRVRWQRNESSATETANSWAVDGYWHTTCDGVRHNFCDTDRLREGNVTMPTEALEQVLGSADAAKQVAWRTWARDGTCMASLKPKCFKGPAAYRLDDDAAAYVYLLTRALNMSDTDMMLRRASIVPTASAPYDLAKIQAALMRHRRLATVICEGDRLSEISYTWFVGRYQKPGMVWYRYFQSYYELDLFGKMVDGSGRACPDKVWYLPTATSLPNART